VRALLRSAGELRKAQQRALSGKGAGELQERLTEQRQAVRALARLGRELLAAEGHSVSDAIVERIGKTLDAAALDEGSRFLLRAGVLNEELEPQGFDALVGMTPPPGARGRDASAEADRGDSVAEARHALQAARQEARERAREATEAERKAKQAEGAAAQARRKAKSAHERREAAEQALAEAEAALRDARRRR
jgi:hypothetical protein